MSKLVDMLRTSAQADKSRQLFTPESGLLSLCVDPAVPAANNSTNLDWADDDGEGIDLDKLSKEEYGFLDCNIIDGELYFEFINAN